MIYSNYGATNTFLTLASGGDIEKDEIWEKVYSSA